MVRGCGLDSAGLGYGRVAGSRELGNEHLDPYNVGNFINRSAIAYFLHCTLGRAYITPPGFLEMKL
jgi:hypothetical protein